MTVLDTNLLSEATKPIPSAAVMSWLAAQPAGDLFSTTVSQAELLYGVAILPGGRRRSDLHSRIERMFAEYFAGRILVFDEAAARLFAVIVAMRRKLGRPIGQFDAQIAAIARSRGAALATRNTRDFEDCGVKLINPWNYSN